MHSEKIIKTDLWFLSGGGEMGQLIREKDWSKTPLGAPESWPQSLRTMVAVMLENPFGMYIAWGNDYTQIYNDSYRPILGATKHPQALGISTRETFSEIWDSIIGSMFDDVMKGKAVGFPDLKLPLNRNGFVEECFFDFSYSPIRKDNGEVGGVLVTVIETTNKKNAEDALKESNKRFINNIMQAPVAMCILRGENYVVEIANEQMLNIWGKYADQVMNKPIFEGLPEAKDQGLDRLLNSVFTTGEKFIANERPVNLPRNGKVETTYINFVYEALKEPDGTISGIAAIATEVTPQVISRYRIEESEQKVRALVENAPFPIAVYVGKEMIVELANQSIINIWGKGNDVIGKSFKEVLPELDNQLVFEQIQKVLETGESFHTKNTPLDLIIDGKPYTYYFNYSFTPLYDISGNIYGVMNTGVDLTDLNIAKKQIEESDKRFRTTLKQAPVGISILRGPEYLVEMANEGYLALVDREESTFVGRPLFDSLPEVKDVVSPLLENVLNTGIPFRGNEVPIPLNRSGSTRIFYFDFLYAPLKEEDGKISGIIVTVTEVTEKVEAIKKIEESNQVIRESKERLEFVLESAKGGDWDMDLLTGKAICSFRHDQCFGATEPIADWNYEKFLSYVHPEDRESEDQKFKEAVTTGCDWSIDCRVIWNDGSIHWIQSSGRNYRFIDGKPTRMLGMVREVTAQKEAQKKIEENERNLKLMIHQAPVSIGIFRGLDYTVEIVNKHALELWGRTEQQVLGKPIFNSMPELLSQGIKELLDDVRNTGKRFATAELPVQLLRNGVMEKVYVNFSYEPLYDSDEKINGIMTVGMDVTHQVVARKKIEASEERLNLVVEASELGTYELNLKTKEPTYSKRYLEILGGYTEDIKLTHAQLLQHLHPDDFHIREKAFKKALDTGYLHYEARLIWKDKSIHWMEGKGKVFYNEENQPVKLIGTIQDITEEKNHEQELQESEEKFRLLADSVPQHIWTSDIEGNLNYYNQSVFDYSGLTLEQINKDGWIQIVHPDDRDENIKTWVNSVSAGKDFLFEHRFRRYDGEYRWVLSRAIPQRDEAGNIQMWVGTSTDIHDKKVTEGQLDKLVKERTVQLERSNEDLQQFAHVASHDLKEPLRKIKIFTNRVKEYADILPVPVVNFLEKITNASTRMQMMVDGVLSFSSFNSTEQPIQKIDLNDIFKNVKNDLEIVIEQKKAKIIFHDFPTIEGGAILINQLFYNLLHNSLKFSKENEAPLIEVSSALINEGGRDHAKILIKDNGIGFHQTSSEQIFETFVRLNSKDKYEGTGLGLSLCKKIVERHNGTIESKSKENEGTTFIVTLPVKQIQKHI